MAKKKPSRRSNASSARGTVSGPSRPSGAIRDAAAAKAAATELVAEAFPFNAAKPSEFEKAAPTPQPGQNVEPPHPSVGGSTLSERNTSAKTGKPPHPGSIPGRAPRSRARRFLGPCAHDESRRHDCRQPELAESGAPRPDAARRLHPAREDHAFRPRAHPRAHRACARVGRAWLLRVLQAAQGPDACVAVRRSRETHAGVRAIFHGCRRARLDGYRARRARLRSEVLYGRRQLGPRREQHPGVLHPGRDEVSRSGPRRQAGAAPRACRRRRRRTTLSGISCR